MAVYDLEEQEQIDNLKAWWQTHGNLITTVVAVIAVAVVGWQGWNVYQSKTSAEASVVFDALQQAVYEQDAARIRTLAGELTEKHKGTNYAPLGALMAASASVANGDLKTAQAQLSWVVEQTDDEIRAMARLRLAGVLLDQKAYDEALKVLDAEKSPIFAGRVLALKGDVLVAKGQLKEARVAYGAAIEALKKQEKEAINTPWAQLLQQRLDALGEAA